MRTIGASKLMTRVEYEKKVNRILDLLYADKQASRDAIDEILQYYPLQLGAKIVDVTSRKLDNPDGVWATQELTNLYIEEFEYPHIRDYIKIGHNEFVQVQAWNHYRRITQFEKMLNGDADVFAELYLAISKLMECRTRELDEAVGALLFENSDHISYVIHKKALECRYPGYADPEIKDWIWGQSGMGDVHRELGPDSNSPFVLLENGQNSSVIRCLAEDICVLGKTVYVITEGVSAEDCSFASEADGALYSVENAEQINGYTVIHPLEIQHDEYTENNVDEIIEYISEHCTEDSILYILADDEITTGLELSELLYRRFLRMAGRINYPFWGHCMQFSRYGRYESTISKLYGEECEALINKKPTVKYSIVVPARNSAYTLRHTLETCINQDYEGEYEILVSDNSTGENTAVHDLCVELNNDKIVYIKTPRDLRLVKSFEYAYIHASGEYIMALGSDDGALPWMLSELDKVIEKYPDEEIIQWERGFYAWSGFNGGQQHKMVIPRAYTDVEVFFKDTRDSMAEILNDYQNMYLLPMLYINSCCKRSYLKTLIDKTGRLWDGICQDLDMGIITLALHDRILNIRYPLTIAGMSSASAGAASNRGHKTKQDADALSVELQNVDNVEGFGKCFYERLIPQTLTDANLLYSCILRAIQRRLLPEFYLTDIINWKKWYIDIVSLLDIRDVTFDRKIHETQMCASFHGDEFLNWFNENLYEVVMRPKHVSELPQPIEGRTYQTGFDENGTLTLDASEYGVTNIREAVEVFADKMKKSQD